jgi:ribosome biogenesis GTPase / thiamine phosphate phosphatase
MKSESCEFIARVVEEQRGRYRVWSGDTEYLAVLADGRTRRGSFGLLSDDPESLAELADRLRQPEAPQIEIPVVGDWVRAVADAPGTDRAVIHDVLPRRSRIARRAAGNPTEAHVLAANVDIAFIVSSLNRELSPARLARYVTLARNGGVTPVIVLTKADLCTDANTAAAEIAAAIPGVPVHPISVRLPKGLEAVGPYLSPGTTCVLLGSSGVGKSTLVNHLLGRETQRVSPVRERDDRGRHTTTHRQLLRLPGGALLIDTPGLREIQLWSGDKDGGLEHAFADITGLSAACRFTNCQHQNEPSCAVTAAIAEGTLDAGRLVSYAKLRRELAFLESKQDTRARSDHKRKLRAMNLMKRTRRVR